MALFLSTFINKVDKKGRVSVPATFRAALANQTYSGIIVFPSLKHKSIESSGIDRFEKIADGIDDLNPFSDQHDDFTKAIFGQSQQLPFDSDGRVILSKNLIEYAQIKDNVTFLGQGRTFEIWNPDNLKAYTEIAFERAKDSRSSIKLGSSVK